MRNSRKRRPSLAVRLALGLAAVVALSLFIVFISVYMAEVSSTNRRIDRSLQHEVGEISSLLLLHDVNTIGEAIRSAANTEGTDQMFYRLLTPQGQTIAQSDPAAWAGITVNREFLSVMTSDHAVFETVNRAGTAGKARLVHAAIARNVILQVAHAVEHDLEPLRDLRRNFLMVGAVAMLGSTAAGWFLARRSLAPVQTMIATAHLIASGNLTHRVKAASGHAELDRLAQAFNTMLDRIQLLVKELRDVNDSVAHDLRSLLARIRVAAERLLAAQTLNEEQQSLALNIVEDCAALLKMVDTVLDISEMQTGLAQMRFERIALRPVLADLIELFQLAAEEKRIGLQLEMPDDVHLHGHEQKLRRALANLLDNAVKYTNPGGRITVSALAAPDAVTIQVADTGIGIPADAQPYIFDRFFRADASRSGPGHGLGLSLTAAVVKSHGGTIQVQSVEGEGTTFTLTLPYSAPPSP